MERRLEWAQDGEQVGSNAGCRVQDLPRARGEALTFGAGMLATDRKIVGCGAVLGGQAQQATSSALPPSRPGSVPAANLEDITDRIDKSQLGQCRFPIHFTPGWVRCSPKIVPWDPTAQDSTEKTQYRASKSFLAWPLAAYAPELHASARSGLKEEPYETDQCLSNGFRVGTFAGGAARQDIE